MSIIDKKFNELWGKFNKELEYYIKRKVNNTHDVEDLLQEVSIKIFNNIDKLENEKAIKTWIYRITENTIIDYYKKKKDLYVTPESLFEFEYEEIEEDNMNEEVSNYLKKMIFDLPKKYQEVYDMYENKQMKHKEIVEELDISLSTSKIRLMRSKEMFKKNLLECCDFEVDVYGNIIDMKKKNRKKSCEDGKC